MLRSLLPVFYVRISPDRLVVTNVKTGESISEVPEVAATRDPARVVGTGNQARAAAARSAGVVVNPFSHPRTLISDFTSAEQLLKAFLRRLVKNRWLMPSPRIIIHPLGDPEGGFTQIERRALRELALSAGAAQVTLWVGRELTQQEILGGTFPDGAGVAE